MFLVIKTSSLGDIIQTFPALAYLRDKFPEARIDWVVEAGYAELVRAHPAVTSVLAIDTKKWRKGGNLSQFFKFRKELIQKRYDAAFDFQGNIKSGIILGCTKAKEKVGFGLKSVREWPNIFLTKRKIDPPKGLNIRDDYLFLVQSFFNDFRPKNGEVQLLLSLDERKEVEALLKKLPLTRRLLIAPKSAWPNKEMGLEKLVRFLKKEEGFFLFVWGRESEKEVAQKLSAFFPERSLILNPLKLPQLQYLMSQLDLVIAMDSLPLHLAATTSVPTLSFFGPTQAKKFGPLGPQHRSFQGTCPYNIEFEKQCPRLRTCQTGACIKNVDVT